MGSVGDVDEKKVKEEGNKNPKSKEGHGLLGSPTFQQLENGRFKCVETGHEMPDKAKEAYSHSKQCRLGLIESALAQKKPPLSMFKQDPLNRSKLICKLTGDTINKSEEHIWKHINGSKFLNKLEKRELKKLAPDEMMVEKNEPKSHKESKPSAKGEKKAKKKKKDKKEEVGKDLLEEKKPMDSGSDSEEPDFWAPPSGSRWDFDDGGDRWGSDAESGQESDDGNEIEDGEEENEVEAETEELTAGAKRMSLEIGPSSFASRKKKSKR